MNDWIDLAAVGRILLGGMLLGAGLPALFALGLKAVALAEQADSGPAPRPAAARGWFGLAGGCFLVVVAAVATGLVFLVRS